MLSFFRRIINSKTGVIVTFIVLGVIALAFAAGDVTGLRTAGMGALGGNGVATVGGTTISAADVRTRVTTAMEASRQQQPTLTMEQFVGQGGFDGVLDQLINSIALERFGIGQGMAVSKKSVDGTIASIPGLQSATGKFDPQIYQRLLADRRLTDAQVRGDIARDIIGQQLILPTIGASQVSAALAEPYAALLLEKRAGEVGIVPIKAMGPGTTPTEAELQGFYRRNIARYTVPERRVIRYATVSAASAQARATPTEAEIAAAYQQQRARFTATETRDVSQVVVADQAGANAIAARIKGGTSVADAARAAGLEALVRKGVQKAAYAGASSPGIADAVFGAPRGATVGPIRGPLGWTVARVDAVTQVAGKTLEQARGELLPVLTRQKTQAALGATHDAIDDALAGNASFDEIVADQKLSAQTTRPVIADGTDPDAPGLTPDPVLARIVAAGFQGVDGDAPQMVTTAADGSFALVGIGRIAAAAPRPLVQVREAVARDFSVERARAAARTLANQIAMQANKGVPLATALSGAGRALPPPRPLGASRAQLAANPRQAPPGLALMFGIAAGTAKVLEAPGDQGWLIVKLDRIDRGETQRQPGVVAATRRDIGRLMGREYATEFAKAVRADVGTKTDAAAAARAKAELLGAGGRGS